MAVSAFAQTVFVQSPPTNGTLIFPTFIAADPTGACTNQAVLVVSLTSGSLFTCPGGTWKVASSGTGTVGPQGPSGAAGYSPQFLTNAGVPSPGTAPSANNGDMYINSTTGDLYGPLTGGTVWGSIRINLKGTTGPAGPAGANAAGYNFRGPWAPSTAYANLDVVTYAGSTYECSTPFTSTSTFNPAAFNLWAAAGTSGSTLATAFGNVTAGTNTNVAGDSGVALNTLLVKTNNLSELAGTAASARSNLGLGSAATQSTSAFDASGAAAIAQAAAIAASDPLGTASTLSAAAQAAAITTAEAYADPVGAAAAAAAASVSLTGSYSNPSWLNSLANSKVTGLGSAALASAASFAASANPNFTGVATFGGAGGNAITFVDGTTPADTITLVNTTTRSAAATYGMYSSDPVNGLPQCPSWSGSGGVFVFAAWVTCQAQASIAPPALSGNVNDYTPTGISIATKMILTSSGGYTISGIAAPALDQQSLLIENASTFVITLLASNIGSLAANRFCVPAGEVLLPMSQILIVYDLANTCWGVPGTQRKPVAEGGTGAVTFAAHGLLVGEAATPVVATAVGAANSILMGSGASVDPAFQLGGAALGLLDTTIAPAAITSTQNDYAPTGIGTATTLLVNAASGQSITGILSTGFLNQQPLTIENTGVGLISLLANNAGSVLADRFCLAAGINLLQYEQMTLKYDTSLNSGSGCWVANGTRKQPVVEGGTGAVTLTVHGVLVGETTAPVVATAAGAANTVFMGAGASTDPSFVAGTGTGTPVLATAPTITLLTLDHLLNNSVAPTCAYGTGDGTSPGTACTMGGHDGAWSIAVTTGTTPLASQVLFTVTWGTTFTAAPFCTRPSPADATTNALGTPANPWYSRAQTITNGAPFNGVWFSGTTVLAATTTYSWEILCQQ